jgi:hypothetical protein
VSSASGTLVARGDPRLEEVGLAVALQDVQVRQAQQKVLGLAQAFLATVGRQCPGPGARAIDGEAEVSGAQQPLAQAPDLHRLGRVAAYARELAHSPDSTDHPGLGSAAGRVAQFGTPSPLAGS